MTDLEPTPERVAAIQEADAGRVYYRPHVQDYFVDRAGHPLRVEPELNDALSEVDSAGLLEANRRNRYIVGPGGSTLCGMDLTNAGRVWLAQHDGRNQT